MPTLIAPPKNNAVKIQIGSPSYLTPIKGVTDPEAYWAWQYQPNLLNFLKIQEYVPIFAATSGTSNLHQHVVTAHAVSQAARRLKLNNTTATLADFEGEMIVGIQRGGGLLSVIELVDEDSQNIEDIAIEHLPLPAMAKPVLAGIEFEEFISVDIRPTVIEQFTAQVVNLDKATFKSGYIFPDNESF